MNEKFYKINLYLDVLAIAALYFFPTVSFWLPVVSYVDETIILILLSIVLLRNFQKNCQLTFFGLYVFIFIMYSLSLIYINNLPIRNVLQVFIYTKFLIIYAYFSGYESQYKKELFLKLLALFIVLYFVSIYFTFLQYTFPDMFLGYSEEGRGLNGITAKGIFFSRTVYPEFLVLFTLILLLSSLKDFHKNFLLKYHKLQYLLLPITLFVIYLTFARKELLLFLILVPVFIYSKIKKNQKKYFLILSLALSLLLFYFIMNTSFEDMNSTTFTDKQVRLLIVVSAMEIFQYYFPIGSGPGTFGSIMSLDYMNVYQQFNVPEAVLGWGDHRGPIFDAFIVGLLAEYGLGIVFIIFPIYNMLVQRENKLIGDIFSVKTFKIAFVVVMLSMSMFVPMLLNWTGWLYFIILALITEKRCL